MPSNGLEIIAKLASRGVQETMLARALNLNLKTWRRIRTEDPIAREAWEAARAEERDLLVGFLFAKALGLKDPNLAVKGDATAAMFLLKSRHGYRDFGPTEGSGDGARVAVMINLPAALKPEEYERLIQITSASPPARAESGGGA